MGIDESNKFLINKLDTNLIIVSDIIIKKKPKRKISVLNLL